MSSHVWEEGQCSYVETKGEAWGLEYVILVMDRGYRCGYVRVPENHPWFGKGYSERADGQPEPDDDECMNYEFAISYELDVHGGITFADVRPSDDCASGWWFGFDCAHDGDGIEQDLMSPKHLAFHHENPSRCWGDYGLARSLGYVMGECKTLAAQLITAYAGHGATAVSDAS